MKKFLLACLLVGSAFAGPWGREKGEFFIAPQFHSYRATKYWDSNGNSRSIGCTYKKTESAIYGEYGLSEKDTISVRIPYVSAECGRDKSSGIGDIEIGVLHKIKKEGSGVLSLQGLAIIPTGYSINKPVRIGYGRVGAELSLLGGYSVKDTFLEGGVGYRHYFGYPSEQIRAYARVGHTFANKLIVMDTLELQYGLWNGKRKTVGLDVTLEPNYRLLQNDLFVGVKLGNLTLGAGWVQALWGRNTGKGTSFYSQAWVDF